MAYLCGDNWWSQTAYKLLALAMLLVGGTQAYTVVWDLGDVGIGLMTIFNMLALVPLSGEALTALNDYESARNKIRSQKRAAAQSSVQQPAFVICESFQLCCFRAQTAMLRALHAA